MAFLGIGRQREAYNRRRRRLNDEFQDSKESVNEVLDRIAGYAGEAYKDANQGVEERFGDSLNRVRDQVADDRASTKRTIGKALMAGGGDVTGQGATMISNVTESGNETISNAIRGYTDAARQERRYDLSRGDNLNSQVLNTEQNLMNMSLSQLMNADQLERMRRQSNKQLFGDIVGGVLSAGGSILGKG